MNNNDNLLNLSHSGRLDEDGEIGFTLSLTGTRTSRLAIIRAAIKALQKELPEPQDCPRAPRPFRYCPDCDGSFPCEMKD